MHSYTFLFKKIRDNKGTFHAKMGSIKDRNGMDLTDAEDIKKKWQEYTEELYKKDSNSCPLSQWCHPTIFCSVILFSSLCQSFPASGSFQMSQFIISSGQSIGVSASTSVLSMNTQDWFSLGWTGWISLQSKGLSRVFSNNTIQKHQFFGAQFSSPSNSHIHIWPLEKP